MLQNATSLRKSAPWPPNISDEHVSCTAPATENASLQILFKCPTPAIVFGNATKPSRFAHFWHGAQSLCLPGEMTSERPKVVRACGVFYILIWACASRHKGVHFFDISTSKSAPSMVCLVHFDFAMCFAPQRRALFDISTSKSGPRWCALCILTWKCPSRHSSDHMALRPSGATNHWKNTAYRDFPTFSRTWIFFLLTLSLFDLLSSSLLFSDSSHLCFSSVHIVGSLTSKLPSINSSC